MQNLLEFLSYEACPSIRYRVKKEILNKLSPEESKELNNQILEDNLVKEFILKQQPDGWINEDFHSEKGIETAVRVLCEKGLDRQNEAVYRMLTELDKRENTFDNGCLARVGKILDQLNLGGSQLIRAAICSYAGVEDKSYIVEQIQLTLDVFRYVLDVKGIDDITRSYKNKLVFRPEVKWPSFYNLRLLAYTKSWRNSENSNLLVEAVKRLIEFSPIPNINGIYKNQVVSPASFCMHNFNVDMRCLSASEWMMWFHRMELLARLGVVNYIPELVSQLNYLKLILNENREIFSKKYPHYYFTKWGTYTGLALEQDWKTKNRYLCDLIFRSLLIMHYSKAI